MYDTLLTEIHGPVLLIRRNRPKALNQKLMPERAAALTQADQGPALRCLILTGTEKPSPPGPKDAVEAGRVGSPPDHPRRQSDSRRPEGRPDHRPQLRGRPEGRERIGEPTLETALAALLEQRPVRIADR